MAFKVKLLFISLKAIPLASCFLLCQIHALPCVLELAVDLLEGRRLLLQRKRAELVAEPANVAGDRRWRPSLLHFRPSLSRLLRGWLESILAPEVALVLRICCPFCSLRHHRHAPAQARQLLARLPPRLPRGWLPTGIRVALFRSALKINYVLVSKIFSK